MRYLNKVIFINSADKSLKYAEVNLDGNVHFIGTQGVGKSTLLRAILFFYNANTMKLGIPREKKNFNEYYFPYQNSYIIYEVKTEFGVFCVLSFQAQGRAAFRFFNAAYDQKYFIDANGKAFESWSQIRDAFGREVSYSRVVQSYQEYRDILYGNNKGIAPEFRKYAILESRQYQNIPRTISNVFLNTKLDAEFVKETIISSLNEEEDYIDLTTYAEKHLLDFETDLEDVNKWMHKEKNGVNKLSTDAIAIKEFYAALQFIKQEKIELAQELGYAFNHVNKEKPKVTQALYAENFKLEQSRDRWKTMMHKFDEDKSEIQRQMGGFEDRLSEIEKKKTYYLQKDIAKVLERDAKKETHLLTKKNLQDEREILTSRFKDIESKYKMLLQQLENNLTEVKNNFQANKNTNEKRFNDYKLALYEEYDLLFVEIRKDREKELSKMEKSLQTINDAISTNSIERSETRYKPFYEEELENCKHQIDLAKNKQADSNRQIQEAKSITKLRQSEYEVTKNGLEAEEARKVEKIEEKILGYKEAYEAIKIKIENSKDSLYAWLNDEVPGWEHTIGKVIDEEKVLFQAGLNPKRIDAASTSFYGIELDTNKLDKNVTTVADLEIAQEKLQNKIDACIADKKELKKEYFEKQEQLENRLRVAINKQREVLQKAEYEARKSHLQIEKLQEELIEWQNKAKAEKESILKRLDKELNALSEKKVSGEAKLARAKKEVEQEVASKKEEQKIRVNEANKSLEAKLKELEAAFEKAKEVIAIKEKQLKAEQREELHSEGADTKKLDALEDALRVVEAELNFIEKNRDLVADFRKDKRELFDKEKEFQRSRSALNKELAQLVGSNRKEKQELEHLANGLKKEISRLNKTLESYTKSIEDFARFEHSELFIELEPSIATYTEENKTMASCSEIITELYGKNDTYNTRYRTLQEGIHRFAGNFGENNLFEFDIRFTTEKEYFEFAEVLKEFIEENKIQEYITRLEERFAAIVRQLAVETNSLESKKGDINKVIQKINADFITRNFVGAIKSMELRTTESRNKIYALLLEIKEFTNNNPQLGSSDLFSPEGQQAKNTRAVSLLKQLIKEMTLSKEKEIRLSDSFDLEFRIVENDNDTGWVEKLSNVGSEGTDVLAKAMINIMLLNVFKEQAGRKQKGDFKLHCMMDEIGKLHPNNVKGILKFANDRNILLINSSPTSYNAADYKHTYLLTKDKSNVTSVKRLVSKVHA